MDHLPVTRPLAQWIIAGILIASLLILFLALRLPKVASLRPSARRSPSKRIGLVLIALILILSVTLMWPVMRPSPHDLRNWRSLVPEWMVQGFVLTGLAAAPLTPINPDVSGDGQVDVDDVQQVAACWMLAPGTPSCRSALDLNHDSAIDMLDISLVTGAWGRSFTRLVESSPMNGETGVGMLRETILRFSAPLDSAGVIESNFAAQFAGQSIARRLYLSADLKSVTIFYDQVLPASARVRVTINGDALADALGYAIDVDGDGVLGGTGIIDFDTLTLTTIPGTIVCGRVFASELEPVPGGGSINVPLEGARVTVDGSNGAMDAFSDNQGNFCLDPAPAGNFFVHIDGREATNPIPPGGYYPYVGKEWQSTPGQSSNIGDIFFSAADQKTSGDMAAI